MPEAAGVALRYLSEFTCAAAACEDNCCAGLRIELSAANHANLVHAAAGTRLQAKVDQLVQLQPPGARAYAAIAAGDPWCPFLSSDRLCEVQRELGEAALPDACSLFPRVLVEVRGQHELAASLACPETARLCLTSADAVELVPLGAGAGAMARAIVVRRHDADAGDWYVALLPDVQRALREVMAASGLRVAVQLLLLVDLAARIEPIFHAGTTTFDVDTLARAFEALPARAESMAQLFADTALADMHAVRAVADMLIARLLRCDHPRFNALVRPLVLSDVDARTDAIAAYFDATPGIALPPVEVAGATLDAYTALPPALHAQLDDYTRRYVRNALVKDWYTSRPTLASWLRQLIVRISLSRLLALLHPSLRALADDDPLGPQRLETAAIDAFQLVAKTIEHDPAFMDLCERFVLERGLGDASGLARLLRI